MVYGTAGYVVIAHYSGLEALYMTVITITTVGFEEVHRLDGAGRLFTITVIFFGGVGFVYTLAVIVELLSSGRWQAFRRSRRMESEVAGLRDHVIVCGYGRTGTQVVVELQKLGQPRVVVELNPDSLERLSGSGELHVVGDAAVDDVLQAAGIDRARALVSVVDSDERNVYIVLTARSLNPDVFIVARSSYPDSEAKLRRAGADRVLSPYTLSGTRMAALAAQPAAVDSLDLVSTGEGKPMRIEELVVPAGTDGGLTAASLSGSGAILLAVRSPDGTLRVGPDGPVALRRDDVLIAMGTREQLGALAFALRPAGDVTSPPKRR
ncbi:MAG: TrkA family potassium uptake protein [Candidatus Dormibacteria bacterium]